MAQKGQQDDSKAFNDRVAKLALFKENADIAGMRSGSKKSLIETGAIATHENYAQGEDMEQLRHRRAFQDAMFINLLEDINTFIAENEAAIAEHNAELQALGEQIDVLEQMLAAAEDGEVLELTEEQEELLRAFEEKFGLTIDRDNPESIRIALEKAMERRTWLVREIENREKDIEEAKIVATKIEKIMEIDDPDERQNLLKELVDGMEGDRLQRILDAALLEFDAETIAEVDRARYSGNAVLETIEVALGDEDDFFTGKSAKTEFAAASQGPGYGSDAELDVAEGSVFKQEPPLFGQG